MLRIPAGRRSVMLTVAVFAAGITVGAVVIAISSRSSGHVVVKRVSPAAHSSTSTAADTTTNPRSSRRRVQHPPAQASLGPLLGPSSVSSFEGLARQLGGGVGLAAAPLGRGPIQTVGTFESDHAWSTMKVPVLVTLLHDYEQSGQVLSPQGHTDAQLALEESDNAAAESLFSLLEQIHGGLDAASAAVQQTLASAGDDQTVVNTAPNTQGFTTWGQSIWSTAAEVKFYRALARGCLLGPHDTSYVLGLMRNVTSSQRWGAGAAGYPATVPLAFKAGWGPESGGYLVRQTAIVGDGNDGYVISMIAKPTAGTFSSGITAVDALASWARDHLPVNTVRPHAGCAAPK